MGSGKRCVDLIEPRDHCGLVLNEAAVIAFEKILIRASSTGLWRSNE